MKTEALVARTWDDVVFENRNKDYGAYNIRHEYSKSVITGWGVSVLLACLLIVGPKIAAMFGHEITIDKPIPKTSGPIELPPPPTIIPDPPVVQPPAPRPPAPVTHAGNIQVTQQETDTHVTENIEIPATSSSEGTGQEVEYTGPAVIAPPAEPAAPAPPTIFLTAEVMPKFDGMVEFLSRKLKYPNSARRLGIEGKAYIGFVVSADGSITDVKLVRGFHPDCDKEALRVVSLMPAWSPGMQNKIPVPVRMVVPITFKIKE